MNPIAAVAGAMGLGLLIAQAFKKEPTPSSLLDCSAELMAFYNARVRLPESEQARLRAHRDANRDRLRKALNGRDLPAPIEFIPQGSHAMDTINRSADYDYDIDDGVVFKAEDLVGSRGATFSALDARKFVLSCLGHDGLNDQPELKRNCVRVNYAAGYHVDMPVYRRIETKDGDYLEHAGKTWTKQTPRGITSWFRNAVSHASPDTTDGQQMRRVVRLLKIIATSRKSWNMPSGFIISTLVVENYVAAHGRDDASLYLTMAAVSKRLSTNLKVSHPVIETSLTLTGRDAAMVQLRERLKGFLETMTCIQKKNCDKTRALDAWGKVFGTRLSDS